MRRHILCLFAVPAIAAKDAPVDEPTASDFVGRYDGNSFETAMGMEILDDGTWRWGLSVGALDMRAKGTWEQRGKTLILTSAPKPVAPKFAWSGVEETATGGQNPPFLRVVSAANGKPFRYASAELLCANGKTFYGQIRSDGYPSVQELEYRDPPPPEEDPRRSCNAPARAVLTQSVYHVRSEVFDLKALGWKPGQTARFAFHRNDMGVADFTGVTGTLVDGKLKLTGAEWPLELRKLPTRSPDLE